MDYLKQLRYEWLLVYIFIALSLLFFYYPSWLLGLVCLVALIRLLSSRNIILLVTSLIILLLILGRAVSSQNQQKRAYDLPLNNENQVVLIDVDPIDFSFEANYIRGYAEAYLPNNIHAKPIRVEVIYWLEKETQLPAMLQKQATIWEVEGKFSYPEQARNFGVFDYRNYLRNQKINWQLEISKVNDIKDNQTIIGKLKSIRLVLLSPFINLENSNWLALYNKLLWNLNSQQYKAYRPYLMSMGIGHFFAISGFHLYFLRKVLRYIFLRLGLTIEMATIAIESLLFVYMWLVNWPVGVIRAFSFQLFAKISKYYSFPLSKMDCLAIIGLILLWLNPLYIKSLAYILSFIMTFVIILYKQPKFSSWRQQLTLTLVCLLFSWPIIMQTSHEWNSMQLIIVALFTLLFNQFLMPMMLFTTLLIIFPVPGQESIIQGLDYISDLLLNGVQSVNWLNRLTYVTGQISNLLLLLLIIVGCYFLYKVQTKTVSVYVLPLVVYLFAFLVLPYFEASSKITMIDVGQGDAILYQPSWNQGAWLIDTGGRSNWRNKEEASQIDREFAQRNLIPALKALGVNYLEGVIVTHPDIDHIGSLSTLGQAISIKQLFLNEYVIESEIWAEIAFELDNKGIELNLIQQGKLYQHNSLELTIFSVNPQTLTYSTSPSNDSSLITQIRLGELAFLALGDVSAGVEKQLIREFPEMKGDIIKLAHHGSDTSTSEELLLFLKPDLVLISAGVDNHYGHPHKEVLERLYTHNVPYLSTHQVGAIVISYHPFRGYEVRQAIN